MSDTSQTTTGLRVRRHGARAGAPAARPAPRSRGVPVGPPGGRSCRHRRRPPEPRPGGPAVGCRGRRGCARRGTSWRGLPRRSSRGGAERRGPRRPVPAPRSASATRRPRSSSGCKRVLDWPSSRLVIACWAAPFQPQAGPAAHRRRRHHGGLRAPWASTWTPMRSSRRRATSSPSTVVSGRRCSSPRPLLTDTWLGHQLLVVGGPRGGASTAPGCST